MKSRTKRIISTLAICGALILEAGAAAFGSIGKRISEARAASTNTVVFTVKGWASGKDTSYVTSSTKGTGTVTGSTNTVDAYMIQYNPSTGQVKGNQTSVGSNWSMYNSTAIPGAITKIAIAGTGTFQNNLYCAVGTSSVSAQTDTSKGTDWSSARDWSFNSSSGYTYFKLYSNKKFTSGNVTGVSVTVTYEVASADPEKLATPSPSYNDLNKTVSWSAVTGASSYQVKVDSGSYATATSPFDVSGLTTGSSHTVSVKAIGDGKNYTDSDAGSCTFTPTAPKEISFIAVTSNSHREFDYGATFVEETITATYSDLSTADVTNLATFSGYNMNQSGAQTVSVSYGGKSTSYNITVGEKPAVPEYTLVTDAGALQSGDKLLIVGIKNSVYYTISPYATGNNCKATSVSDPSSNVISTDAAFITLGGSVGSWTLYDGTYYLYAAGGTGSNNYLKGAANANNDNAKWTIGCDGEGKATIKTVDTTVARHTIRFNQNNTNDPVFACYASGQSDIYLYRNGAAATKLGTPTGFEYSASTSKLTWNSVTNATGYKVSVNGVEAANPTTNSCTLSLNLFDVVSVIAVDSTESLDDSDAGVYNYIYYGDSSNRLTTSQAKHIMEIECTATTPFTEEMIYVSATVTDPGTTTSYGFQNVKVSDGTTELLIYSLTNNSGVTPLSVGDVLKFYAYGKNQIGTLEFAGDSSHTYPQLETVERKSLTGISITTQPNKVVYSVGDKFDPTGMVVKATYDDGSTNTNLTGYTYPTTDLTITDNTVQISYTEGGVTKTANVSIDVTALDHIEVEGQTESGVYAGTNFAFDGKVYAYYKHSSDGQVKKGEQVTTGITTSPVAGTKLVPGENNITVNALNKSTSYTLTADYAPVTNVTVNIAAEALTIEPGEKVVFKDKVTIEPTAYADQGYTLSESGSTYLTIDNDKLEVTAPSYTADALDIVVNVRTTGVDADSQHVVKPVSIHVNSSIKPVTEIAVADSYIVGPSDVLDFNELVTINPDNAIQTFTIAGSGDLSNVSLDTDNKTLTVNDTVTADGTAYITITSDGLDSSGEKVQKQVTISVLKTGAAKLESIEVGGTAEVNPQYVGHSFNPAGLTFIGHYEGELESPIAANLITWNSLVAGVDVTGTYTDKDGPHTIEIGNRVSVLADGYGGIKFKDDTALTKDEYFSNEDWDFSGLEVEAFKLSGDPMEIEGTVSFEAAKTPAEVFEAGETSVSITATYNEKSVTESFPVTVTKYELVELRMDEFPTQQKYTLGDKFNTAGMKVSGKYSDGHWEDVTADCTVEFDSFNVAANSYYKVIHKDGAVLEGNDYHVQVSAFVPIPAKKQYELVTSAPVDKDGNVDWSGTYVLAYTLDGTKKALCNNTSNTSNYIEATEATSSDGVQYFDWSADIDAVELKVEKYNDNYAISALAGSNAGLYLCNNTSDAKAAMGFKESKTEHTLSLNGDGSAAIYDTNGEKYLKFNKASGQTRFRYYASGQESVYLYKYVEQQGVPASMIRISEVTNSHVGDYYENDVVTIDDFSSVMTQYNDNTYVEAISSASVVGTDGKVKLHAGENTIQIKVGVFTYDYVINAIGLKHVESITMCDDFEVAMGTTGAAVSATLSPDDVDPSLSKITYSIVSGGEYGSVDADTGAFTPIAPGTVVIQAEADGKTDTCTVTVVADYVTNFEIVSGSYSETQYEGAKFDTSSIKFNVNWASGKYEQKKSYSELTGITHSPSGELALTDTKVTFTYGGKSADASITVNKAAVTSITAVNDTESILYEGTWGKDNLTVKAVYNNGNIVTLDDADYTISGFDNKVSGEQTVTISYKIDADTTFTTTVKVTVGAAPQTGIRVVEDAVTVDWGKTGNQLLEKLTVLFVYKDGTESEATALPIVSGFDGTKVGKQTVTVSYGGFEDTVEVTVNNPKVTEISVEPTSLEVSYGVAIADKLTVTAKYEDGTSKTVTGFTISGYDATDHSGAQTVTVSFEDVEDTLTVTVAEPQITEVIVTAKDTTNIPYGRPIQNYITVKVKTEDGSEYEVTGYVVVGFEATTKGQQEVKIYPDPDDEEHKGSIVVTVVDSIDIKTLEANISSTSVAYNTDLSTSDFTVDITYTDDLKKTGVAATKIEGYTKTKVGDQTVKVYIDDKNYAEITIKVLESTVIDDVEFSIESTDIVYDSEFTADDVKVVITYTDGHKSETVAESILEDGAAFDTSVVGAHEIVASYGSGSYTKTFNVNVLASTVVDHLEIISLKDEVAYDGTLTIADFTVKAVYTDDHADEVASNPDKIEGFDGKKLGNQEITLTFKGKTVKTTVKVLNSTVIDTLVVDSYSNNVAYGYSYSINDITLTATYTDGRPVSNLHPDSISGFEGKVGENEVHFVIANKEGDLTINVLPSTEVYSIVAEMAEGKETIAYNTDIDLDDIIVTATYTDGHKAQIQCDSIDGFSKTTIGKQTITVYAASDKDTTVEIEVLQSEVVQSIVAAPNKNNLTYGDSFDETDVTVIATYTDGHTGNVDADYIEGFTGKPGINVIKVYYGEFDYDISVVVLQSEVVDYIEASTAKTEVSYDGTFTEKDVVVSVFYTDGREVKNQSADSIDGFDSKVVGAQTVTVYAAGKDTTITVTVLASTVIDHIEVSTTKTEVIYGSSFVKDDVSVTYVYTDNHKLPNQIADDISGFDSHVLGAQEITVNAAGKTAKLTVTVVYSTVIEKIEATTEKSEVEYGGSFTKDDVKVVATYADGHKAEIACEISGFDPNKVESQTITVSAGGKTTSIVVKVNASTIVDHIEASTTKSEVPYGGSFTKNDVSVTVYYTDGHFDPNHAAESIEGFNSTTIGEQTITVKAFGKETTIKVTVQGHVVTSLEVTGYTDVVDQGKEYTFDGVVKAHYADGQEEVISEGYEVSKVDTTGHGQQKAKISYGGVTVEITINVIQTQTEIDATGTVAIIGGSVVGVSIIAVGLFFFFKKFII